jgi:hypothetical protein
MVARYRGPYALYHLPTWVGEGVGVGGATKRWESVLCLSSAWLPMPKSLYPSLSPNGTLPCMVSLSHVDEFAFRAAKIRGLPGVSVVCMYPTVPSYANCIFRIFVRTILQMNRCTPAVQQIHVCTQYYTTLGTCTCSTCTEVAVLYQSENFFAFGRYRGSSLDSSPLYARPRTDRTPRAALCRSSRDSA